MQNAAKRAGMTALGIADKDADILIAALGGHNGYLYILSDEFLKSLVEQEIHQELSAADASLEWKTLETIWTWTPQADLRRLMRTVLQDSTWSPFTLFNGTFWTRKKWDMIKEAVISRFYDWQHPKAIAAAQSVPKQDESQAAYYERLKTLLA